MKDMFCFQCQQTAHNIACEGKAGVCGKKSRYSKLSGRACGCAYRTCKGGKIRQSYSSH